MNNRKFRANPRALSQHPGYRRYGIDGDYRTQDERIRDVIYDVLRVLWKIIRGVLVIWLTIVAISAGIGLIGWAIFG